MFRRFTRIGILAAVAAAALALSGNALANPSTPQLAPIPPTVFAGQLTVSWSPSTFDPGALLKWYELQVFDYTVNSISQPMVVFGTSKQITVLAGHTYGLRLQAANLVGITASKSPSATDLFHVIPFIKPPIYYEIEYRIWPEPCRCPLVERFLGDDPVMQRARELVATATLVDREIFLGHRVDARGQVSAILG